YTIFNHVMNYYFYLVSYKIISDSCISYFYIFSFDNPLLIVYKKFSLHFDNVHYLYLLDDESANQIFYELVPTNFYKYYVVSLSLSSLDFLVMSSYNLLKIKKVHKYPIRKIS